MWLFEKRCPFSHHHTALAWPNIYWGYLIFRSPEPLGSLVSLYYRHASVVRQQFKTSPLKPLGQLKPNFISSLHRMGERKKFIQMVQVTWPWWPPYPYMVKTLKNIPLQNQKADDLETWYVALGARVLPNCSNDDPGLTLTYFTGRSNLVPYAFAWEKK